MMEPVSEDEVVAQAAAAAAAATAAGAGQPIAQHHQDTSEEDLTVSEGVEIGDNEREAMEDVDTSVEVSGGGSAVGAAAAPVVREVSTSTTDNSGEESNGGHGGEHGTASASTTSETGGSDRSKRDEAMLECMLSASAYLHGGKAALVEYENAKSAAEAAAAKAEGRRPQPDSETFRRWAARMEATGGTVLAVPPWVNLEAHDDNRASSNPAAAAAVSDPAAAAVSAANGSDAKTAAAAHDQQQPGQTKQEHQQPAFPKSDEIHAAQAQPPSEVKQIALGDPRSRSKLKFEVVTARVAETGGKKHVTYTITIRRAPTSSSGGVSCGGGGGGVDTQAAVIERRYNDFGYVYECILRQNHPTILGDYLFPKKVLIGNFKAEVITERTESFHKFLNLISNCDTLLYSEYFYSFLTSQEHNEAVSYIKLAKYQEAVPLLENIFYVREKLLTISNINVLQCLCELLVCQTAVNRLEDAFSFALVAARSFDLLKGHPDIEALKVPFLKLASFLAASVGHDKRPYDKQLSELRYRGTKTDGAKSLLEVIREKYIHRASHTTKFS